jgi:ankyrin repeat protein
MCWLGLGNVVVQLLKHGKVDLSLHANSGDTALSLASMCGHTDIVWELLKHNPCEALASVTSKFHSEIARSPALDQHGPNETCREDEAK